MVRITRHFPLVMVSAMDKFLPGHPLTPRRTKAGVFLFIYVALLLGNALDAYNLGPIPVQWLAQLGMLAAVVFLGCTRKLYIVPGSQVLLWFLLWAVLVTVFNSALNDFNNLVPLMATTAYPLFVILRFLTICSFIAALYLVYWLLVKGYREAVIKWTVAIGTIVSIAAIYIYFAQMFGLPELPRNRMGTDGAAQSTMFSYAFHRAMGTFREPSHLAEWLVAPFFFSLLSRRNTLNNIHTVIIGTAILLTGSLTGIVSAALGFAGAILIANPLKHDFFKTLLRPVAVVLFSLAVFYGISLAFGTGGTNLGQVIGERLTPIFSGSGMEGTDRGYIYRYVTNAPVPLLGAGFGNANLLLSQYFNVEVVTSFLSLYFNVVFSAGIVGLALIGVFLLYPVVKTLVINKLLQGTQVIWVMAAYLSWIIMFAVHPEELTIMFAVAYAALAYEIRRHGHSQGG